MMRLFAGKNLISVWIILICSHSTLFADESHDLSSLAGPAFSAREVYKSKNYDEAWQNRPVKHKDGQDKYELVVSVNQQVFQPFKIFSDQFASEIRKAGWKFYQNELIGEPDNYR